jgi:ribose-phosphate pyrophosphokinase
MVLLSGTSHPGFVDSLASILGMSPSSRVLAKFSSGETRCEIQDSVRGKDVYIVQTFGVGPGGGRNGCPGGGGGEAEGAHTVNDYFVELCIMISACKTGGAKRVTAVLPLFPYSRQPDLPFSKAGAPLVAGAGRTRRGEEKGDGYTFESVPATPGPSIPRTAGLMSVGGGRGGGVDVDVGEVMAAGLPSGNSYTTHDYENPALMMALHAKSGHKMLMAQAGSLVADLLTCAGADRILTCDLHESSYQGFFDIPGMFLRFPGSFTVYLVKRPVADNGPPSR